MIMLRRNKLLLDDPAGLDQDRRQALRLNILVFLNE